MPRSICILGDIMLDIVTHLDHIDSIAFENLSHVPNSIEMLPGGTGVIAALSAIQKGFSEVSLIGKIGCLSNGKPDIAAQIISNELNQAGVKSIFSKTRNYSTGKVMITTFNQDRRILVADKGANGSFTMEDITPLLLRKVAISDVFFVSGYSLLVPTQAQAIIRLTQEAKENGRVVVLDVVPHEIYNTVNNLLFAQYTQNVGVLVSGTNTIQRLFPETMPYASPEDEKRMAERVLSHYDAVILRSNNERQIVLNRGGFRHEMTTGYSEAELTQRRGYLDRLTMRSIFEYYDHLMRFQ